MPISTTDLVNRVKYPFVDRKEFIQVFQDYIENLGEKKYNVLAYYGVAGIGKTSLRKELPKIVEMHNESQRNIQILWGSMDFVEKTHQVPYKFLEVLATQLHDKYNIKFNSFEIARAVYLKKIDPRASLKCEDFFSDGIIVDFLSTAILGELDPVSLIQKILKFVSKFPEKYSNCLSQRKADIKQLPSMEAQEIEALLPVYWAKDFCDHLNRTSEKAVIFIDSYEALWREERHRGSFNERDKWIRALVENLPECTLFVIFGQDLLRWEEQDSEWRNYLDQHQIGDLPEENAIDLLTQSGIVEEEIQKVIVKASEGVPYYLKLSIDTYRKIKSKRTPVPEDFALIPSEISARFIKYLDKEKPTIKALAVPNFWDQNLLETIITEIGTQYPLNELSELYAFSFMFKDKEKWRMHRLMRKSLIETQKESDIKKVNEVIFNYYDEKLKDLESRNIKEEHQVAFSEAFYHGKSFLGAEEFFNWFINKFNFFYEACLWSFLLPLNYQILQITETELGNQSPAVSRLLHSLGTLLFNIGRREEAIQNYERALKIRETLLIENPKNADYKADVGLTLNNLGPLLFGIGRREEAKQKYERASEIYETLVSEDPENLGYKSKLGATLTNFGNLFSKIGRIEEAKQKYERASEIYEILVNEDPENVGYKSDLGALLHNLGNLLSDQERREEAKQKYEQSLEIYEALLNEDLKNVGYKSSLGMILNSLGNLLLKMGRLKEAEQKYERASEIYEVLISEDPENLCYKSNLGIIFSSLGNLLSKMERRNEAKQKFDTALKIRETLLSEDPENISYKSNLGATLNNLGNLLLKMGIIEEAKQKYERALKIRETLFSSDPENLGYKVDLGVTLNNLGNLLLKIGRIEEAKQKYERALEIYKALFRENPQNLGYKSYLGMTFDNLGNSLSKMDKLEDAKQSYEHAIEIYETLLRADPENLCYKLNLGMTFQNLGSLLSKMGILEDAKQNYEHALDIYETLLRADPENVGYKLDVRAILNNLQILLFNMGLNEEAQQKYESALKIHEELLRNHL